MRGSKAKKLGLAAARKPFGTAKKLRLAERDPDMMFLGGLDDPTYDDALIGTVQLPCKGQVAVYDYEKCIDCLIAANDDDTDEDKRQTAIEWMEYNVVNAFVGDKGPVFFYPDEPDDEPIG